MADPDRNRHLWIPYCGGVLLTDGAHGACLPWLLILACPLMHLFMHHGHRGGHGQAPRPRPDNEGEPGP